MKKLIFLSLFLCSLVSADNFSPSSGGGLASTDKATTEDISAGVDGKWIDAKTLKSILSAPQISLNGLATLYIQRGVATDDPKASVISSGQTVEISADQIIDVNLVGTQILYYNFSDEYGNAAKTVTRTIIVSEPIASPDILYQLPSALIGDNATAVATGFTLVQGESVTYDLTFTTPADVSIPNGVSGGSANTNGYAWMGIGGSVIQFGLGNAYYNTPASPLTEYRLRMIYDGSDDTYEYFLNEISVASGAVSALFDRPLAEFFIGANNNAQGGTLTYINYTIDSASIRSGIHTTDVGAPIGSGTVDAAQSTMEVPALGKYADGVTSYVRITAKDASGNIIDDATVTLSGTGSQTIGIGVNNNNGTYTFPVINNTVESVTFTAIANGVTVTQTGVITYSASPSSGSSDIIDNSVDMIWEDMTGANTGWVSNMPSGFGQFQGPTRKNINDYANNHSNMINVWFEVEGGGDGSSCSPDINLATNTRVQVGWTRGYYLMNDNSWVLSTETIDQIPITGDGTAHPHSYQVNFPSGTGRCNNVGITTYRNIQLANDGYQVQNKVAGQFTTVKPKHYYRYHAWAARRPIDLSQVKGLFGQTYMRLIVEDPNLPDDRHLANYVAHISSDSSNTNNSPQYTGDYGISRYKEITNDWQPINFFSGSWITKAELAANPPPFWSTP